MDHAARFNSVVTELTNATLPLITQASRIFHAPRNAAKAAAVTTLVSECYARALVTLPAMPRQIYSEFARQLSSDARFKELKAMFRPSLTDPVTAHSKLYEAVYKGLRATRTHDRMGAVYADVRRAHMLYTAPITSVNKLSDTVATIKNARSLDIPLSANKLDNILTQAKKFVAKLDKDTDALARYAVQYQDFLKVMVANGNDLFANMERTVQACRNDHIYFAAWTAEFALEVSSK